MYRPEEVAIRRHWVMLLAFAVPLTFASCLGGAQEIPFELTADSVFISSDQTLIEANGNVVAQLEDMALAGDSLRLEQGDDNTWQFEATGNVQVSLEGELELAGDALSAMVALESSGVTIDSLEAKHFSGQSTFENSDGDLHTIYFHGKAGSLSFDAHGDLTLIAVEDVEVSTCDCCGVPLRSQPYALQADRLLLYPDQLIVVFGLTARIGGVPSLWLPVYVQPLEDTLESPLFPSFGRSALRGWYMKWNVPFYFSESLFGSVLLDYYAKHSEFAAGAVARYAFGDHSGRVRVYSFPAKVGDSVFEFSASHELPQAGTWTGSGRISYRESGDTVALDYGAQAKGSQDDWNVRVSASREAEERNTDDEDESNDVTRVTERFPEISMSRNAWEAGLLSILPRFEAGLYREQDGDDPSITASRVSGSVNLTTDRFALGGVRLSPSFNLQAAAYMGDQLHQSQASANARVSAQWGALGAEYALQLVQGDSPFAFDTAVGSHHIGVSFSRGGWATLDLSTGFDLVAQTADPLQAELRWALWADWTLQASYRLEEAVLESVKLAGGWTSERVRLSLAIPYQPIDRQFETITLTATLPGEQLEFEVTAKLQHGILSVQSDLDAAYVLGPLELSTKLRFQEYSLDRLEASATFTSDLGWGARTHWTYPGGQISVDQFLYGVFWDVGGCLRIGIDRDVSDTWFYVSILAFPEAILRYAPQTARIQTGN